MVKDVLLSIFSLVKKGLNILVFLFLLVDIKCIYFVTKTRWGFSLFLFSFSVVLGTKLEEPGLLFLLCFFFSSYVWGIALTFLVLVKTPLTRRYLRALFGEDYLVKHLGKHMMTKEVLKLLAGAVAVFGAAKGSEYLDLRWNLKQGDDLENAQKTLWKQDGYTPSLAERQHIFDKANELRYKEVRGLSDQVWQVLKDFRRE